MLIDTGDRIEGNALYDASDPKGLYTFGFFKEQNIDILCAGNHELYRENASKDEYIKTVSDFKGNYLASNIDIFDPKSGERVPLAPRYKKFTTKNQGIRVVAFGFLFDFKANANNTVVQPVEETIKEKWFQQAIGDKDVDLFLVVGHVPLRSEEFKAVFKAIRKAQWDTPIQFFGGHTHVRDYSKYDSKAFALESGRYMETIGFMSISGLATGGKYAGDFLINPKPLAWPAVPKFSRRYIDNNLFSYYHHTALNSTSFPTDHGRNVSAMISSARKALHLDKHFGCAPWDLWTNRAPYPSNQSIFTWLQDSVIPDAIRDFNHGEKSTLVLVNTGALRFDIFEGAFTLDTVYAVSPFSGGFRYVKDVPFDLAKKLLILLNNELPQLKSGTHALQSKLPVSLEQLNFQQKIPNFGSSSAAGGQSQVILDEDGPNLSPGYTTQDDDGSDGDDTVHSPIQFFKVPNFIESRIDTSTAADQPIPMDRNSNSEDANTTDLVFLEFVEPYVLLALKFLGGDYELKDTKTYMEGIGLQRMIAIWVQEKWKRQC